MTTLEMLIQFNREVDQYTDVPDYNTEDILHWLNTAQYIYLRDTYLSKQSLQENLEYIQKRSDDLKNLIITGYDRTQASYYDDPVSTTRADGGYEVDLPTDYLFHIQSYSFVSGTTLSIPATSDNTLEWIPNRVITHDELQKVVVQPYNRPILRKPAVLFEYDGSSDAIMIVYVDENTSIHRISYTYLKEPTKLTFNSSRTDAVTESELPTYTHREIVSLAVKTFIDTHRYKFNKPEREK